jgi:hypothetical protein
MGSTGCTLLVPAISGNQIRQLMTVKEFFNAEGITSIVPFVRVNANGYPFVTLLNASNEANNLYFASNIAKEYPEGTPVGKGFFNNLTVYQNKSGYWRFGSALRVSVDDLF